MAVKVATQAELQQAMRDKSVVILVQGRELTQHVYMRKRRYRWMLFWCVLTLSFTVVATFMAQSVLDTTVVEVVGEEMFMNLVTGFITGSVLLGLGFAIAAFTNPLRSYRYIKRTLLWAILHRV